ncbi:MAG: cytochrome b/b6 domain-containing protein [Pseudomonadota bacterium]
MYSDSYSLIQRLLHWAIAVVVLALLAGGLLIGQLGFDGLKAAFGQSFTNLIYNLHKSFGVLVLGLMICRVLVRLLIGKPDYSEPLPAPTRIASEAVHGLLYVCLIAMPLLGWFATASGGFPVEFFSSRLPGLIGVDKELSKTLFQLHEWTAYVILAAVGLHIAGGLFHWLVLKDRIMGRISLF